jgi:uncharacterized cupin superfamily protein
VGILWNISLSAETTAGEFTMMDQTMPGVPGPRPTSNERYDEGFFIIEGAVEYTVGQGDQEQTILDETGAAVWIPRGTRHAFEVKSDAARALKFYTPAASTRASPCSPPRLPRGHSRPPTAARAILEAFKRTRPRRMLTVGGSPNCTHSRCPDDRLIQPVAVSRLFGHVGRLDH